MHSPSLVSCRLLAEEYRSSMPTAAEANKWLAKRLSRPSYNIAVLKCQIRLRYSSSDSILNPFSEAETDETMLEQQ